MATAPSFGAMQNRFPLVNPIASDAKDTNAFDVIRHFGSLQPWFSVPSAAYGLPDASPVIPNGCDIVQVHLLHRHGARYPTSGPGPASFATKLHEAASSTTSFEANGDAQFLRNWTYKLGAEILTPFGRSQLCVFYFILFLICGFDLFSVGMIWVSDFAFDMVSQIRHVNLLVMTVGVGELLKGFEDVPVFRTTSECKYLTLLEEQP